MTFGGIMKRTLILPLLALALPLAAQSAAKPAKETGTQPASQTAKPVVEASKPVAVVNGEVISAAKLDELWKRIPPQTKDQYKVNGGKAAFLNNYIGKRLLVQEALKAAFDRRSDVQADVEAARESALFDRYVRDIVAADIVTEADARKYYDAHPDEFQVPAKIKVRHIVMVANPAAPNGKTKEQALEAMKKLALDLNAYFRSSGENEVGKMARLRKFGELAARYSDDGSAQQGGDLGWVDKSMIDSEFGDAAFGLPVGTLSGIVETKYGYHLIYVEEKKPAGLAPFEDEKGPLHEFLLAQHQAEVVNAVQKLTNELRSASKVAVYPENIQ
jgi:peptidyl-prolyl cis-trans isomerase C